MGKLGPPLLAGEPAPRGGNLPPVVFPFTHDALSDVDCTLKTAQVTSWPGVSHLSLGTPATLTFLLIEVAVDVPLHLCVALVSHPGQMFTGDDRTRLIVERSGGEVKPLSKLDPRTRNPGFLSRREPFFWVSNID